MQEHGTLSALSDRDRRWLVHIFAALQQHIEDELEHDGIPFHDQNFRDDPDRFGLLWTYVHDALTRDMERTHPEEALLVSGLQELEGTNIAPVEDSAGVDHGEQPLRDDREASEHPFATWVREHVLPQNPDVTVWHRGRRLCPAPRTGKETP